MKTQARHQLKSTKMNWQVPIPLPIRNHHLHQMTMMTIIMWKINKIQIEIKINPKRKRRPPRNSRAQTVSQDLWNDFQARNLSLNNNNASLNSVLSSRAAANSPNLIKIKHSEWMQSTSLILYFLSPNRNQGKAKGVHFPYKYQEPHPTKWFRQCNHRVLDFTFELLSLHNLNKSSKLEEII